MLFPSCREEDFKPCYVEDSFYLLSCCHTQAKLKLKEKLGWLDNQLEADTTTTNATATTVLFEPGVLLGNLERGNLAYKLN